jgi:hypothetical protein
MIVEVVIAVLATALAAVTVVCAVIGILGIAGMAGFDRCTGCDRVLMRPRGTATGDAQCTRCRHPHLAHPVHTVRHPHDALLHH